MYKPPSLKCSNKKLKDFITSLDMWLPSSIIISKYLNLLIIDCKIFSSLWSPQKNSTFLTFKLVETISKAAILEFKKYSLQTLILGPP